MKNLLAAFLTVAFTSLSFGGPEVIIADSQNTHDGARFIWSVDPEHMVKVPEWKVGSKIPLDLDEAVKLASDWTSKQFLVGAESDDPRPRSVTLFSLPQPYNNHYAYRVQFGPLEKDSFWTVFILLDGTVLKPQRIVHDKR